MSSWTARFVAVALMLLILVGCMSSDDIHTRVRALQSQLKTDLPVGTPRLTIEGYLRAHNLKYEYIPSSNEIVARDVGPNPGLTFVRADALITFTLDTGGRLSQTEVKPALVGP